MKQVTSEFYLEFTTENYDNLPTAFNMKHEVQEVLAAALDKYLSEKGVDYDEVHAILPQYFDIDDVEDDE